MDRRLMNTTYLQAQLQNLHSLHRAPVEDYGQLVTSLNKECDVFCNSIPGYKIRPLGSNNNDEEGGPQRKQKKEVHDVERLELELLTQYEHFLQLLGRLRNKSHPESQALGSRLTARLIPVAHEFNHADKLLKLATEYANAKSSRVAQPALKALSDLFDSELVSDATLYVAESVLNMVKREEHAINPKLLGVLLHIRVAMIDVHRPDIADQKAKDKRQKKEDKELARLLQKSKARTDRAELAAKQTVVLQKVFSTYLRVLQASKTCSPTHQTKILAPTLEGLAKFANLINLELFQLLMKALKEILEDEHTSVVTKLHALVAVACLAERDAALRDNRADATGKKGHDGKESAQAEWKTDLAFYHNVLFAGLLEALSPPQTAASENSSKFEHEDNADNGEEDSTATDTSSVASTASQGSLSSQAFSIAASMAQQKHVQRHAALEWTYRARLVVRAVDLFFLNQKHLPLVRVAGVTRRLIQFAPHCPPNVSMSITALAHKMIVKYPQIASMVIGGNDFVTSGRGVYDAQSVDLHSCHADTSFAWEAPLLSRSFHPTERQLIESVAAYYCRVAKATMGHQNGGGVAALAQPQSLSSLAPYDILEVYDAGLGEVRPAPPRHSAKGRSRIGLAKKAPTNGAAQKKQIAKPIVANANANGKKSTPNVVEAKPSGLKLTAAVLESLGGTAATNGAIGGAKPALKGASGAIPSAAAAKPITAAAIAEETTPRRGVRFSAEVSDAPAAKQNVAKRGDAKGAAKRPRD